MRTTARLLVPGLLLVASILAGCGASAGPGQQAAAATAAPTATPLPPEAENAPIPEAFRGVWTTDLRTGGQSHGAWRLRITEHEMELLNPVAKSDSDYFPLHSVFATQEGVSFDADADCL